MEGVNLYVAFRDSPTNLIDPDGRAPVGREEVERALREARGSVDKLVDEKGQLLIHKGEQEVIVSKRAEDVGNVEDELAHAQTKQLERGETKALERGSGNREIVKKLERAQLKLQKAKDALEKTVGRIKAVEKQITIAEKTVKNLVAKAGKVGADVHAHPSDPKVTAEHVKEAGGDPLEEKFAALEGRETPLPGDKPKTKGSPSEPGPAGEGRAGLSARGFVASVAVNVAVVAALTMLLEGRLPRPAEVAAAFPPLAVAQATNHGDTAVPIMLWFGGRPLANAAMRAMASIPLAPQVGMAAVGLAYGVPQASARGMAGHFLSAKGGYSALVCAYPGLHPCP